MFRSDQPKPAPVGLRAGVSSPPGTDVVFQHPSQRTVNSAPGQQGLSLREFNERCILIYGLKQTLIYTPHAFNCSEIELRGYLWKNRVMMKILSQPGLLQSPRISQLTPLTLKRDLKCLQLRVTSLIFQITRQM